MTRTHHRVRLGRLDALIGPHEVAFPNRKAALAYADIAHGLHPNRVVVVKDEQGRNVKRYGSKKK